MDIDNCAMNKIKQIETEARNEGYERLPNSEDVTLAIEDNEMFNETTIQNIIESSSNKNKISLSLSQEQICTTIHADYPTAQSNVNHERLPHQSLIDSKKSLTCKAITKQPSLAINTERNRLNEHNSINKTANNLSELSDFSLTENEKSNLLRKFSVSVIGSNHQAQMNWFDFNNTYGTRVLEKELKCTICNDAFQDPRVLDCLHSFCYDCLADIELVKYNKSKANDLCELDLSCE